MDFWQPVSGPLVGNAAAGLCVAGAIAELAAHPLATVKARLHVQGCGGQGPAAHRGILLTVWTIARAEGPFRLYAGAGALLAGSFPGQGLQFGAYDVAKRALADSQESTASHFVAGACAQLAGSLVLVPADVVKERLQVRGQVWAEGGKSASNSFAHASLVVRKEGVRGLYRGFLAHQVTWLPFSGLYFALYEWGKARCIDAGYEDGHDNLEPTAQLCCGAAAGVIASALTNPLDILKTRVQVAQTNPEMFPYSGALQAARHLLRHEGAGALMNGAFARALHLTTRLTLCTLAYEQVSASC